MRWMEDDRGNRRLCIAMIRRALADLGIEVMGLPTGKQKKDDYESAYSWIFDDETDPEGLSFQRCCEILDLNVEVARASLIGRIKLHKVSLRRSRRRVRLHSFRGEKRSLYQWCEVLQLNYQMVAARLDRGWTVADALTIPPKQEGRKAWKKSA